MRWCTRKARIIPKTTQTAINQPRLWTGVALLLVLALSRMLHLNDLQMHTDEIWSVWQTFGTLEQVLQWIPYNWPPLYFVLVAGWKDLTGISPYALRVLSVLLFLLLSAILYRFIARLRDIPTAVLVTLAFAALGFSIRVSTEVRGYILMFLFLVAALWFTELYFSRPTFRRALLLAASIAGVFYTYLPGVIGYLLIGVYSLIVYRRQVWRWWLPGLLAALMALPLFFYRISEATDRAETNWLLEPPLTVFSDYFTRFTTYQYEGYPVWVWLLLVVVASALVLIYRRRTPHYHLAFAIWAFVLPVVMYLLNPVILLFYLHYSMVLMLGLAVWVGWGLAWLPRLGRWAVMALLVGLSLYPFHLHYVLGFYEPFDDNMAWLADNIQWGDVILIDPGCTDTCEIYDDKKWDYFTRLYFPEGLHFVDDPGDHRRVWYVTDELNVDPATLAAVSDGRVPRQFVGPAGFLWRLWEAPPDAEGALFENGMRFHGADILKPGSDVYATGPLRVYREGETVRLRLWWSAARQPDLDYSIALYLITPEGEVIAQSDSQPQVFDPVYPYNDPPSAATSQWQPGQFYLTERELTLPYPIDITRLDIKMAVYDWQRPEDRIFAYDPDFGRTGLMHLGSILVDSW